METQKIVNLLNGFDNDNSKFATKKWYMIDSESNGNYSQNDEITFSTRSIESSLCDSSDAYILEINETFVDEADFINIAMPMYNLLEYSDNYSDTSGSLWQFKRDETTNNAM